LPDEELMGTSDPDLESTVGLRIGGGVRPHVNWFVDGQLAEFDTETFAGDGRMLAARGGAEWIFRPDRRVNPFFCAGWGYMDITFDSATDFFSAFASLGFGQHVDLDWATRLRWEIRVDHTLADAGLRGHDMTQVQVNLGVNWRLGGRRVDTDTDGVRDRRDGCPDTPRGAEVDASGCPTDGDGDGVWDGLDLCPQTPPQHSVQSSGCVADADLDGVPDERDACPQTPAGAAVDDAGCAPDMDGDGVPDVTDRCLRTLKGIEVDETGCFLDRDGDGVYDGLGMDHCLDTPPGAKVDVFGCPIDSDGDGVLDGLDRCPDTPSGTPVDDEGCPRPR
jgi:hypothetical protein